MDMTSENLTLRLELLKTKAISKLLTTVDPVLSTVSELVLSTLAWSETYLWYLEISADELESRLKKEEPADTPPDPDAEVWEWLDSSEPDTPKWVEFHEGYTYQDYLADKIDWTPLD